MRFNRSWIAKAFAVAALAAGTLLSAGRAEAADKLHLKDGRVLEGRVVRELDGVVWFSSNASGIEQTQMFAPAQIVKLERDATTPDPKAGKADTKKNADAPAATHTGVPRIAVLTLGEKPEKEMVGLFITAKSLRETIPQLEKDKVTDVVLRINSGGGMLLEIEPLSDLIQNEFKPRFRTVAWIEWAISAAAMTAHAIPEIYMTRGGAYGACTGWHGALVAVKDRQLEDVLALMENISARANRDPKIMRSMQIMDPLSATIDANGDVHWYQNEESGEYKVNRKGKVLCFNSVEAAKYRFSKGTADTIDELAKAMGYQEVEWVGVKKPGVAWPVCKADELLQAFRNQTFEDQERTREYMITYQQAVELARAQQEKKDRGKFINIASKELDKIEAMVKNNPNLGLMLAGDPDRVKEWVEEQRRILRELAK
jgi:hypothetical protein